MKKLISFIALLFVVTACSSPVDTPSDYEVNLDAGTRLEYASNPAAYLDEDATVYLHYNDTTIEPWNAEPGMAQKVSVSEDGLEFEVVSMEKEEKNAVDPHRTQLADGTWRFFMYDMMELVFKAQYSEDGINFTPNDEPVYELAESDNGTAGVYDFFVDTLGNVVMLYIGDMGGADNIRKAYSSDNGEHFELVDDNFLGDAEWDALDKYVDPNTTELPDGRRLLLTMVRGENRVPLPGQNRVGRIVGFILDADGNIVSEPMLFFEAADFTEFDVWSLNDPVAVAYDDGSVRIYVAALVTELGEQFEGDPSEVAHWMIVSATVEGL